jgi:hypothetical protein
MKTNIDVFLNKKFTHIGFYSGNEIITWNEIYTNPVNKIEPFIYEQKSYDKVVVHELIVKYKISDEKLLENRENQKLLFLLDSDCKIFYINVIHLIKKNLFSCGIYKGIDLQILLENIAYENSYPYHFIFKHRLTFEHNHETFWNLLNNSMEDSTGKEIELDLDFMIEELIELNNYLKSEKIKITKNFFLKLRNNQPPIIQYWI